MDVIKIDRVFVADLGRDRASLAIVSAVVTLAHDLQMTVVAEGVETARQLAVVTELGVDACQGFFFAEPVRNGEVPGLLTRGTGRRAP